MPNNNSTQSLFDNGCLCEVETAIKLEDVINVEKTTYVTEYEGNNYYFSCATIHPSFALFIPATSKHIVDGLIKKLNNKKESENDEIKHKAFNECMSVLIGVNETFQKYSVKGGVRLLEQYSLQRKTEYLDFCNDVMLYYVYMKVYFNKPFSLWDINQIKELGLFREN